MASRRGAVMRAWLAALVLLAQAAHAHVTGTGLATLEWQGERAIVRLTLAPSEIGEAAKPVMAAVQGDAAAARQVGDWLQQHLRLAVDDAPCRPLRTRLQAAAGGDRVVLQLDLQCPAAPGRLQLDDTLSTPFGEHYRTITSVARPDRTRVEQVFDHQHTKATFDFGQPAPSSVAGFLRMGASHILSGWDHLLFLAALLIGQRSLRSLLITVTAFTAAHSLSLAAATFGWLRVAPVWVEPVIAMSVVWMALENVVQRPIQWRRHALTFAFGLVHGLAFAEALVELNLRGWPLAGALFGFNLGVEAAQVIVVLLIAPPLAWLARQSRGPQVERVLSFAIAAMGLTWLVQRLAGA
jgi:hypothetical protein